MSITVVTGTPGAGKTLYTVGVLLAPLVGQTIKIKGADGIEADVPRVIYSNIKGLLLDHEQIAGEGPQSLNEWHLWAKPGAIIVFDEIQDFWKPRPNGSAVPAHIDKLTTHRHMGVDFIIVTQNVMLLDRNVHALADRHLHIRRLGNLKLATVYEWDHVSRGLHYAKALSRSGFRYPRKVFEQYKSAEVHTRQTRKLPGLIWYILAGLVAMAILGPMAYRRITARAAGPQPVQAPSGASATPGKPLASATQPAASAASGTGLRRPIDHAVDWKPRIVDKPETAPAYDELLKVVAVPAITGAICVAEVCRCYTQQRTLADVSDIQCLRWVRRRPFDPYKSEPAPVEANRGLAGQTEQRPG